MGAEQQWQAHGQGYVVTVRRYDAKRMVRLRRAQLEGMELTPAMRDSDLAAVRTQAERNVVFRIDVETPGEPAAQGRRNEQETQLFREALFNLGKHVYVGGTGAERVWPAAHHMEPSFNLRNTWSILVYFSRDELRSACGKRNGGRCSLVIEKLGPVSREVIDFELR